MKHEEFLKVFEIPDDEFTVPGRDYDEDGNLASWYVEHEPAQLTYHRLFLLTMLVNTWCDTALTETSEETLKDEIESKLISQYKKFKNSRNKQEDAIILKRRILDIFAKTQPEEDYDG